MNMAFGVVNTPGTIVLSRKCPTLRGECGWQRAVRDLDRRAGRPQLRRAPDVPGREKYVTVTNAERKLLIFPVAAGDPKSNPGTGAWGDTVLSIGRTKCLSRYSSLTSPLGAGTLETVDALRRGGNHRYLWIQIAPDGGACAYSSIRDLLDAIWWKI